MMLDPIQITLFISEHYAPLSLSLVGGMAFWRVRARSKREKRARQILKKAIDTQMNEPLTMHPEFNAARCVGCGTCTRSCPEGDVIQLINHRPTLVAPAKCIGHGACEAACPNGAITLVFGTKTRGMDIPRITADYETNVPGLYIAGELGGMGLIHNAVRQGHLAAKHALGKLGPAVAGAQVDLLVVGAGPAGLAASLTAIAEKKKYLCIEQNSFGGTVFNFPRQKLVHAHPTHLPMVGKMKFPHNHIHKEELLAFWTKVRKDTGLKVTEKVRFESMEFKAGLFHVKTSQGTVTARKLILAMGLRGSPRKLGLPNEDLPKVAYNLIDPAQYQSKSIAIVGAGNAAVEAAIALAKAEFSNKVTLLVRGPALDRCNEENKNSLEKIAAAGQVSILYNTSTKEIQKETITVEIKEKGPKQLANHFLFVMAGADLPTKFLMGLGVKIDKKFGEALSKAS